PAGDGERRHLSRSHLQGACREPEPRNRLELLAAAAGECHRQLGQGGAAPAGPLGDRRSRSGSAAQLGSQRHGRGGYRAHPAHSRLAAIGLRRKAGAMTASSPAAGEGVANRGLTTVSVMAATFMQALDTTIANVALPRMQGSLAASQDQMAWVLTS